MTKTDAYLKHALALGWRVTDDGIVYNSKGTAIKIKLRGKAGDPVRRRYPRVSISKNNVQFSIEVHKLAALYFLGDSYWENKKKGWQVRHLDGNVLNLTKSNITMGTCSDNNLDKPEISRKRAAQKSISISNAILITCSFCNKTVPKLPYYRWHAKHDLVCR